MLRYSLSHPTKKALDKIGIDNVDGGRKLLENILNSYGIYDAKIYAASVTEIRLETERPLCEPATSELSSFCEIKEI